MKKLLPEMVVVCALLLVVGYGFAQTWTRTSATLGPFDYFAESADGRTILAIGSGAFVSINWGGNWNYAFQNSSSCGAMSADGSRMIAAIFTNYITGNLINISTNTGVTWNPTILPNTNWSACASSADGRVLAAAVGSGYAATGGNIYTSTNFGANWRTNTLVKNWRAMASSANGTRLVAAANGDYVYLSTNSGLTWQATGASGSWLSVACSMDGLHLVATGNGTVISTNGGSSWRTLSLNGSSVASSADGSRLILVNGGINISTNYGLSWSTTNISGNSFSCAGSSADGHELFTGGNGNNYGVWIWQATPSSSLSLVSRSNNVTLSWPVPSTNLVVQQSADLAAGGWIALTNLPVLNYTNLQNSIFLPATNGSFFYRLASP